MSYYTGNGTLTYTWIDNTTQYTPSTTTGQQITITPYTITTPYTPSTTTGIPYTYKSKSGLMIEELKPSQKFKKDQFVKLLYADLFVNVLTTIPHQNES